MLMNQNRARVKLPHVIIKDLVSGSWCNRNADRPGKLSVLFTDPICQTFDEEILLNAFLVSEGKGLLKDKIKDLINKETHAAADSLEQKEKIILIVIFQSIFVRKGLSAK